MFNYFSVIQTGEPDQEVCQFHRMSSTAPEAVAGAGVAVVMLHEGRGTDAPYVRTAEVLAAAQGEEPEEAVAGRLL